MNVPPLIDPSSRSARLQSISIRDLRNDPSMAPGGGAYGTLVSHFLPIVFGIAERLAPASPGSSERITDAVFECFSIKWRRLSKRTLVGPWLVQAVRSVALRERKRLRQGKPPRGSSAAEFLLLFKRIAQLKSKLRNALLLQQVLLASPEESAAALKTTAARVQRRSAKAARWLQRKLKKTTLSAAFPGVLQELQAPVPDEIATAVAERFGRWSPKEPRAELTRATLVSWRWARIRLLFKRVLAGIGATVCILAMVAGAFVFLAQHGYLTGFFIHMGTRQMAKDNPEVLVPARPWPVTPEDIAHAAQGLPKNTAELYDQKKIWPAKLSFTREQWEQIQPTRITPVRNLIQNGRIILRNPKAKRSGLSGALGYDFNWAEANFEFSGKDFGKVGARYRGNGTYVTSLYGSKQSYKVDLNKHEKKKLAGIDELNFVNSIPDFSYVHDSMAQRVFRELGVVAPRTTYAYLSISVPGKWTNQALGLYCVIENIDNDFAEDRFGSKIVPIFKPVTYDLFVDMGSTWKDYEKIYDLKTEATDEQLKRVIEFAKFVTHSTDQEFAAKLADFLDIEEVAAFLAGHVLLSSYDGFLTNGQNYYLYLDPRSNKFGFISWDQDHSWGEFGHIGTAVQREEASIWKPAVYDFRFLERALEAPAFREAYRRKLEEGLKTIFTKEKLYPEIDQLAAAIRPAVAAESDFRLKRFDQAVSSKWVPGDRDAGPAEGPRAPVHQIKRFIENRIASVRAQLDGKSEGRQMSNFR